MLDELGIDYVEGGYPGANPTDSEFFARKPKLAHARFTAFGMTRRPGRSAANDPGLAALLEAKADAICFVAKSSAYQVRVALETTNEENLASIRDSVTAANKAGREVMVDCEHFFDGYKENPEFALACAKAAYDSGARWVVLCDTNGGTLPHEVESIVAEVIRQIPGDHIGIHAHNDTEQAVANSLAAVRAARARFRSTLNGLGERCGNANLCSLIPTLRLKNEFSDRYEIGVSDDKLSTLMKVSRTLDDMLNRAPNRHAPYVGESAFATKTGIHASAVLKDPQTYEHVSPGAVGNHRKVLVSDQAGRSNVIAELDRAGIAHDKNDPKLARLVEELKDREAAGYAYESANASFDLLARRTLGRVPDYFRVEQFDVNVEQRYDANGRRVTVAMAVVKVDVDGEEADLGRRRQRSGQCARRGAAQGPRQIPEIHRRIEADRLSGAHPQRRHRSRNAGVDRERGRSRRALDHRRRVAQYHRRVFSGVDGLDHLQAGEIGCAGMIDHISVGVSDLDRSAAFYEAALAPLGFSRLVARPGTIGFGKSYP